MQTVFATPLSVHDVVYLICAIGMTGALSALLWSIGRAASACPVSGPSARSASIAVIGAYASIALGIIVLIAALGVETGVDETKRLLAQLGAAAIINGVGFSIAASTLRDLIDQLVKAVEQRPIAPAPQPAP